jgi:hypothetical protein
VIQEEERTTLQTLVVKLNGGSKNINIPCAFAFSLRSLR